VRIFLLILTNAVVMFTLGLVVSLVSSLLGGHRLNSWGFNLPSLLWFSLLMGFTGAFISLALSKTIAKWTCGLRIIGEAGHDDEAWLVQTVRQLAQQSHIGMPEVGIFEGDANAFATGAFKNSALVAVSSGLLHNLTREQVQAVIAHEVAHIANGDMVTMTLISGVVNTFVTFLGNIIWYVFGGGWNHKFHVLLARGVFYTLITWVLELVLGFGAELVVCWFSRQREFRADAGAVRLMGRKEPMIEALRRLGQLDGEAPLPHVVQTLGIAGNFGKLWSTHPSIEERIAALRASPNAR
jgi:heat shock protein HtpX